MNSKILKHGALLTLCLLTAEVEGINVMHKHQVDAVNAQKNGGIFGKLIELSTAGEKEEKERHEATLRKQKQLEEAE